MDTSPLARLYQRIAFFSRLILFDKRGTGLSDRVAPDYYPDLETRMIDVQAVMDAAGLERAVILGLSEGGPMAMLFAATYPGRTIALVAYGETPRYAWAPDFPWGQIDEELEAEIADARARWGTKALAADDLRTWFAPSVADNDKRDRVLCHALPPRGEPRRVRDAYADEPRDRRASDPPHDPGADA